VLTRRRDFGQWSSNNTEIERLERFSTASDFHQAEQTRADCDDKAKAVQDELAALQAENEESLQVVATHDAQIAELTQSKEQEMGSEFKEIEHQVTEKSKKMVRLTVTLIVGR
jgi:flagellar motility protein MotE (MotC chaperone)